MGKCNIIESALNSFPTFITRTPTLASALAHSALDLILQGAISASSQEV